MTKIEWTDRTWNPVVGCSEVSAGCTECYAKNMAHRLASISHSKDKYAGLTRKTAGGKIQWTGKTTFDPYSIHAPVHWKKPSMIFVCSMGDLFHPHVPFEWVDRVMETIGKASQHIYQILTKHPDRMAEYFSLRPCLAAGGQAQTDTHTEVPEVWLGTSVENQKEANERIPYLLRIPGHTRFLSCEPLLGPIDLYEIGNDPCIRALAPGKINWVIAGGESGRNASPMHPDWVRSLRDQCAASNVPFFFKQWGEWIPNYQEHSERYYEDEEFKTHPMFFDGDPTNYFPDMDEYDRQLKRHEKWLRMNTHSFDPNLQAYRYGKIYTGHTLDGQIHQHFPNLQEGWGSKPPTYTEEKEDYNPEDEADFDPCGDCVQEDACRDFGCAVKAGIQTFII